jgi:hypothetical protein
MRAHRCIHIVLDTNPVWVNSPRHLISHRTRKIIEAFSGGVGVAQVRWYMPWVAVAERQYQMNEAAAGLLKPLREAELLFGTPLKVDTSKVSARVRKLIDGELVQQKIEVLKLDTAKVNWNGIIDRSVFANRPLSAGKTRKVFETQSFWKRSSSFPQEFDQN